MRVQGCAPKEIRVRFRRFRIGEIAIVHGSDPQAFHCLASNQVVDVAADADRSENYFGSTNPNQFADPDTYLSGQPGINGCYPASAAWKRKVG